MTLDLQITPEVIITRLREIGLRQFGGACLPLADRWDAVREAPQTSKLAVCNALDGDPRAQTARFMLHKHPRAVLEGLLIAGRAIGAESHVLCVEAGIGDELSALGAAVEALAATEPGLQVRVVEAPATLVGAEETALIRLLEGRQPLPYLRATGDVAGVQGAPTLVETAQTLAQVAALFDEPAVDAGCALVALTIFGDLIDAVTIEVPASTTIAGAIEQAAGRPLDELAIKTVQIGGPATAFIGRAALATPLAPEDLAGAAMTAGTSGIEIFGAHRCAVELARDVTARLHDESCGKCVFCREGSRQMLDILNDIVAGKATDEKMELLRELSAAMRTGSICSIGWGAALPTQSALELFADDFAAHLAGRGCPGGDR